MGDLNLFQRERQMKMKLTMPTDFFLLFLNMRVSFLNAWNSSLSFQFLQQISIRSVSYVFEKNKRMRKLKYGQTDYFKLNF